MNHTHRAVRISALLLTITAGCAKPLVNLTGYDGGEDSDPELGTAGNSTGGAPPQDSTSGQDSSSGQDSTSGVDTTATEDTGGNEAPTSWGPEEDCNADTWVDLPDGQPPFDEVVEANWDVDALTPVACTHPLDCDLSAPLPGLKAALIVRNDQLPAPRDFVPASARWLVWSNVELGCADPFGVPLCKDQWRVSFARDSRRICEVMRATKGAYGFPLGPDLPPLIVETGDANCEVESFTFPPDARAFSGDLALKLPDAPVPWGTPVEGYLCMACETPGAPLQLTGEFSMTICQ